jgi:hypothetical protein
MMEYEDLPPWVCGRCHERALMKVRYQPWRRCRSCGAYVRLLYARPGETREECIKRALADGTIKPSDLEPWPPDPTQRR